MQSMADPLELPLKERLRRFRIVRSRERNQKNKRIVDTLMFCVQMMLIAAFAITLWQAFTY